MGPVAAAAERARLAGASPAMVLGDFSKKLVMSLETLIEVSLDIAPLSGSNFVPARDLIAPSQLLSHSAVARDMPVEQPKRWKRTWVK